MTTKKQEELDAMTTNELDRAARQARGMGGGPDYWNLADQLKAEYNRRLKVEAEARLETVRRDTTCTDNADRHDERPNHRIYDALRDLDERHDDLMTD